MTACIPFWHITVYQKKRAKEDPALIAYYVIIQLRKRDREKVNEELIISYVSFKCMHMYNCLHSFLTCYSLTKKKELNKIQHWSLVVFLFKYMCVYACTHLVLLYYIKNKKRKKKKIQR